MIHPVILCGGGGTRLWPRSRVARPKPFLELIGARSLFRQTVERCSRPDLFEPPVIVAGPQHIELIGKQLPKGSEAHIIAEPMGKNTAPAIALAAARLPRDAVMLVCPSDHHIGNVAAFTAAAETALPLAKEDWLVAFGIEPDRPETGYGYIKRGEALGAGYQVDRFVEKPDLETAKGFLASGKYSWNGGIFCLRAGAFLDELARYRPAMMELVATAVASGNGDGACFSPDAEAFGKIEGDSIDYAVMEETAHAAMVPVDMAWSDIGNWQALRNARPRDEAGNTITGKAELVDCRNVLVETDGPRVSAIGLEDAIIVVDGDEVLVTTAAGAQLVGKLKGAAVQ